VLSCGWADFYLNILQSLCPPCLRIRRVNRYCRGKFKDSKDISYNLRTTNPSLLVLPYNQVATVNTPKPTGNLTRILFL